MRAIIIGAGKVGYSIAAMLTKEKHDVIVIEQDEERAQIVDDNLDVKVVVGNGASRMILNRCDVAHADLLVAVTKIDEINMLACLVAKQEGVAKTVARVRNPEYANDTDNINSEALGIDFVINPEKVAAREIANLIRVPEALGVNYYADGKLMLIELQVQAGNEIINKKIMELPGTKDYVIAAILRDKSIIIPGGSDMIYENDCLYIMAERDKMIKVEESLGFYRSETGSIVIVSASRVAYYLAKYLERDDFNVKVIEKDYARCKWMADQLESTTILQGDGIDVDLLQEEGISDANFLVALTDDDKLNIVVSLLAKQLGTKKTISQIKRSDYLPLVNKLVDICISPRLLTAEAILKFVRKADYMSISLLNNGGAEVYEVVLTEKMHKLINKKICDIHFPKGAVIGAIFRQEEIIIPSGKDVLQADDRLVVFTAAERVAKIEAMFS